MDQVRAHDKAQRYQSEYGNAFFDDSERALPDHEPDDECNGYGPPLKTVTRGEFERDANAANFSSENDQTNECKRKVKKRKVVEAKTFANRVGNCAPADCREAP